MEGAAVARQIARQKGEKDGTKKANSGKKRYSWKLLTRRGEEATVGFTFVGV